jgi:hypothetical protein
MLYEVGWRIMECHRIREGIRPCVGDASRTVYRGESNVVQNNATILRFVRIAVRQNEILPSGRKTYSLTEDETWMTTCRFGGTNTPRQTELSTNNTVLVPKVQFGRDENIQYGD